MTDEQRLELISQIKAKADNYEIVSVWEFIRGHEPYKDTTKKTVQSIAHEIKMDIKYSHDPANGLHNIYLNYNYPLEKSVLETGNSVMETNRIQKITLILTIGVSVFTAAIAWLTYQKSTDINITVSPPTQKTDTLRLNTTQRDTFLLYTR